MAKQVRIDDSSFDALERISKSNGKSKNVCASLIITLFEQILNETAIGGRLLVEADGKRTELLLPIRFRKA